MLGPHLTNRCIIRPNLWQPNVSTTIGHLDQRHVRRRKCVEQLRSSGPRNDAIPMPVAQPGWRLLPQIPLFQEH